MPAMIVWPVSVSVRIWKVGSSSARRCSAVASFSWSTLVFGSIARWMTGWAKTGASRMMGWAGSQSVSPVKVCFMPTTATMSPVKAASLSSRWLACIWRMRPMRSLRSWVEFDTAAPALTMPE